MLSTTHYTDDYWDKPVRVRYRSGRPVDSQRKRCYAAERWAREQDPALMVTMFPAYDSLYFTARYSRRVYADKWIRGSYPWIIPADSLHIISGNSNRRRGQARNDNTIVMPAFARYPLYTLHELAHLICWPIYLSRGEPGHGPAWSGTFLALVHRCMGFDAGMLLREGFKRERVNFTSPYPFTFPAEPFRFTECDITALNSTPTPE